MKRQAKEQAKNPPQKVLISSLFFFFSPVLPKLRARRRRLRRRSIVASRRRRYLEGGARARLAKQISLRGHLNLKSNHSSQSGSEGRQSKRLFIFLTLSGVRRTTKWQPRRREPPLSGAGSVADCETVLGYPARTWSHRSVSPPSHGGLERF